AGLADKIRGDYVGLKEPEGSFGFVLKRPVGVVAAIAPWNFPLTLMANKVCPALAAGCTVVLKPASTTPLATLRCVELMQEAGLPVKRLYVFAQVAEQFMQLIASRAQRLKVAPGMSEGAQMGPLHTAQQRAEVEAQVQDAVTRGAKVLVGGKRPEGTDYEKGN